MKKMALQMQVSISEITLAKGNGLWLQASFSFDKGVEVAADDIIIGVNGESSSESCFSPAELTFPLQENSDRAQTFVRQPECPRNVCARLLSDPNAGPLR